MTKTAPIDVALERNRAFAETGGYQSATPIATLRLLVIACLDPRTDPAPCSNDVLRSTYAGRIGVDEAELRGHAVLDPAKTVATDVAL
jgi:hypothetical protein